jgi:hypothetical protein
MIQEVFVVFHNGTTAASHAIPTLMPMTSYQNLDKRRKLEA